MSRTSYVNITNIMKLAPYDYYFQLKDDNGLVIFDAGKIPLGRFTVNLGRYVIYKGKPHVLEFAVWK